MTLQQLEIEENELRERLNENLSKQRDINTVNYLNKIQLKIGDSVTFMSGRKELTGVLDSLEYNQQEVRYPIIRIFNSDGKLGKRTTRVWYSEVPTLKLFNKQKTIL